MRFLASFYLLCLVLSFPSLSAFPQVGVITTVAGGGPDNIPSSASNLLSPSAVSLDRSGNVYFADASANRIYRVNRANGQIAVIAGSGSSGFAGDGDTALKASLFQPMGVAVDNGGNVFIADYGNNRVRRVDAVSGFISTVAGRGSCSFVCILGDGGLATNAFLDHPQGIAVDNYGNLFIADTWNNRVREVAVESGIIRTLAGGGVFGGTGGFSGDGGPAILASLDQPTGVTVDGAGNLYIADAGNNRVRRLDAVMHVITTLAGNGATGIGNGGFTGDGGPATAASLNAPSAVSVDATGNVLIADAGNGRIREVEAGTGVINTAAGNGCTISGSSFCALGDDGAATQGYLSNPIGVAVDSGGTQFIADEGNGRIRQVGAASGTITTFAGAATGDGGPATAISLSRPASVASDRSGNLFIAEGGRIHRIDAATQIVTTVSQNGEGVAVDGAGNLFISNSNFVRRVDASTAAVTTVFQGPVFGIAVDSAGDLYVVDQYDNCVWLMKAGTQTANRVAGTGDSSSTGSSGDGGPATSAHLYHPSAAAVDKAGNLFIADTLNECIRRVDAITGIITTVAGTGGETFSGDGGPARNATLAYPVGVVVDVSGNLFIADALNNRIRRVDAISGIIASFAGSGPTGSGTGSFSGDSGPATSATVNYPDAVAIDNHGNLLIADSGNNRIRRVSSNAFFVSSGFLAFGSALLNTQSPSQSFTINNASSVPLTFAVSLTGEFVESDNCLPAVAPGSSCQVTVSFAPTAPGPQNGTVTIAANSGSAITVMLVGAAKSSTTVALSSSQNPQLFNQPVTFTATVTGQSSPTSGAVAFFASGRLLGISTLSGGQGSLSTVLRGITSVNAQYYGDMSNYPSTSTVLVQRIVFRSLTTLTVASSMKPSLFGQAVTFTATVKTGTVPDGELITFKKGLTVLATVPLLGGSASLTTSALTPGVNAIVFSYAGDPFFYPTTAVFLQTVEKVPTAITLTSSANPVLYGKPVTFAANVTSSGSCAPNGYVLFLNGATVLGAAQLNFNGTAALTRSILPAGTLAMTATYLGNTACAGSTSTELLQTITFEAQLLANPVLIDFGNLGAGNSSTEWLTLTNVGNASAIITQFSSTGIGFSLGGLTLPYTLASGASVTVAVTYTPPLAGSYSGTVNILSNAVDSQLSIPLTGTATHSVSLIWNESDLWIAGYNVYRGTQSGGPYAKINSNIIPNPNWGDTEVQPGMTYFYVVTAVSYGGMESGYSSEAKATVPNP